MFCPKCGGDAADGQRFCKLCGTNLQLINSALRGDASQFIHGVDLEALKQNAIEFAKSWKEGWGGVSQEKVHRRRTRELQSRSRDEARRRNLPRPKEWMPYSWQHNLRNGLLSLFGGAGLGVLLYYLGHNAVSWGLFEEIPNITARQLEAIQRVASLAWMISVLPVLKGLAQIFYASFFAESMKTLSERFTVPIEKDSERISVEPGLSPPSFQPLSRAAEVRPDTAPVGEESGPQREPPSVTEHTTHIFDQTQPQQKRETQ